MADECCKLAVGDQFRWAGSVAFPYDRYVPMELWDDLSLVGECPAWVAFNDAVVLAERIDSFLAVLETDRRAAALAQDSRGDGYKRWPASKRDRNSILCADNQNKGSAVRYLPERLP